MKVCGETIIKLMIKEGLSLNNIMIGAGINKWTIGLLTNKSFVDITKQQAIDIAVMLKTNVGRISFSKKREEGV